MTQFILRVWAEAISYDCNDYTVEAASIEEATAIVLHYQRAIDGGDAIVADSRIAEGEMLALSPQEQGVCIDNLGVSLVNERAGHRVRDLIGLEIGTKRVGEPLAEPLPDFVPDPGPPATEPDWT